MTGHDFQRSSFLYRLLSFPRLFALARSIIAPGATAGLTREVGFVLEQKIKGRHLLDIGCGPESWLTVNGHTPVGVDINEKYVAAHCQHDALGAVSSADHLPFSNKSFSGVWSVGVFHHLPDALVKQSVQEMIRVCEPDGYVAIIDAVYPNSFWRHLLGALIRRLDRGKFMRFQDEFMSLLPNKDQWSIDRRFISPVGLEVVVCVLNKSQSR